MTPLLLAAVAVLAVAPKVPQACTPVEAECIRVTCDTECWEVRVEYRRDGAPAQATVGGVWGSIQGARCWADRVSERGFWLEGELQPSKVPPAALDLVVIDRAGPQP